MAYETVTVAISMNSLYTGTPSGRLRFEVSDFVVDTNTGAVVLIPPVLLAFKSGGQLTPVTVDLVATDAAGLSSGWTWILMAELDDRELSIPHRSLTVNFANGPAQGLAALLATSTIVP